MNPSSIITGAFDGVIRVWSLAAAGSANELHGHQGCVNALDLDSNGYKVSEKAGWYGREAKQYAKIVFSIYKT